MIFNVSEISSINFSEVIESHPENLRISMDGNKTFIRWEGDTPASVEALTTKEGPYTYSQILLITSTVEWNNYTVGL